MDAELDSVGLVIGTGSDPATPLEFWVAVRDGQYLQLDDVVALERSLPGREPVRIYGVVGQMRARHEGVSWDGDVFLVADGILPAEVRETACVQTTRFEPEVFVPPLPGSAVRRATGAERDTALFFDGMERKVPIGLSRDEEPLYLNLDFLDGGRGAHVNISGISGVATKTTYATFLLYSLFTSGVLGPAGVNTKALVFNVKGEDLLFLDHENTALDDDARVVYRRLGLEPGPFPSVDVFAPPRKGDRDAVADVGGRGAGVTSYFWTVHEFCRDGLLPFLFTDAEDERQQYPIVIGNVTARLAEAEDGGDGAARIDGQTVRRFHDLVQLIDEHLEADHPDYGRWAGRAIGQGTVNAFVRRLYAAIPHVEHLIRADVTEPDAHRIGFEGTQVTVVDIHQLHDRAQRFVVGVVLRSAFDRKERAGAKGLQFVVLDELNKYAPREGSSPIKEILLDIAERGRSLGIILIGAQQTASEVERRVISNSAIRVVGRLDSAEASRGEYGFLPDAQRKRASILKPGTMLVSQPQLPVPLVVEFPFPAWATRQSEAGANPAAAVAADDDPFARFDA